MRFEFALALWARKISGALEKRAPGAETAIDSLLNPLALFIPSDSTGFPKNAGKYSQKSSFTDRKQNEANFSTSSANFEFSRSSSEHYETASIPSRHNSVMLFITWYWILWNRMLSPGCFLHSAGEKWTFPLKESYYKNKILGKPTWKSFLI